MPKLLGIINITPDSFSDGGLYFAPDNFAPDNFAPDKALAHARALVADGADILDLGPASSHPDSAPVDEAEEARRLMPVLNELKKGSMPLSVDSFLSATQLLALAENVAYLNDIHGFADAKIYPDLAASSCGLIIMHALQSAGVATRQAPPDGDIFDHICRFFDARLDALAQAGISSTRFILDPGMGFFLGNRPESSLNMLSRLAELRQRYDLPVLVSVSRKSFLRAVTGCTLEESGAATLAAELFAALQGADYIRTHDPAALRDGLKLWARLDAY